MECLVGRQPSSESTMPHAHIDLRYVLASLGYRGGLKGCERQLGLDRQELQDVDGFFSLIRLVGTMPGGARMHR